jgi:YVTN family beta-propeller protein
LHASAVATTPNGRYVVVANTGADTLSVIDTQSDKIVETIWTRQDPGDLFGAQPNALTFDKSGKKLFVCNGTQNAVAVFRFRLGQVQTARTDSRRLVSRGDCTRFPARIRSMLRTRRALVLPKKLAPNDPVKFNSHLYFGTLSFVRTPD